MTTERQGIPLNLQDILPKWAHFCLYTERFITHDLGLGLKGKTIVAGISGGVDSTALLMVLHYLSSRNACRLVVAHLNHSLRPEADGDAAYVSELCSSLNIDCEVDTVDVAALASKDGIGIEEAGRNARYAFFERVRKECSANLIAVGHHLDDLCEDVLMRFIRGTGWPGLSGMTGHDQRRYLVRPFLMLPKSTLKAFVEYLGIMWREDATNHESSATRNRIRNDVLPLIMDENPNFRDAISRLWKIGRIEADYWESLTSCRSEALDNAYLQESHKAVRLRLYKSCLDSLGKGQAYAHTLFKLDEAWLDNRIGTTFQFPGDKVAKITSEGVVFSCKD